MLIGRKSCEFQGFRNETARLRDTSMTAAALVLLLLPSIVMAGENYCSLLSVSEVAAGLGASVSQSCDRGARGPPRLLAQNCTYEPMEVHLKYLDVTSTVT